MSPVRGRSQWMLVGVLLMSMTMAPRVTDAFVVEPCRSSRIAKVPLVQQRSPLSVTTSTTATTTRLWSRYHSDDKEAETTAEAKHPTAPARMAATLLASMLTVAAPMLPVMTTAPPMARAEEAPRVVGQVAGSGLIFKDTLQVEALDDPKVRGVTLYVSTFQQPITERLSAKNLLSDPSSASVSCVKTAKGRLQVADNIARGKEGEEVFEEQRSLLFKTLRVQRIYDEEKQTVVYVSFNTRFDKSNDTNKSRFKSSICAISLND